MRLLRLEDNGEFSLTEFIGNNVPRYAILSHTWGADDQEVSFKDLVDGVGKNKAGYNKIYFCEKQAAKDNLRYFWIDTCCIDKSSSAELSEAINSMFRWYHNAVKCYVYLPDISAAGFIRSDLSFQKSRWFTRGWTLQELLAPRTVEFFSSEGEHLGDKASLVHEIAEITGISVQALQLQGQPLSQFGINERMSWAEGRETKREEDAAYSLLGIFDIHMPLLYGEGRKKALIRLHKEIEETLRGGRQISGLFPAIEGMETSGESPKYNVPFNDLPVLTHGHQVVNARQRILDSLRFPQVEERRHQIQEAHEETCQWILQSKHSRNQQWDSLTAWLSSSTESRRIYWISGKPGSGKSTLMRFLDQNIVISQHMLPWTENRTVLRAQYFFWNPGNKLQKSLTGLLRALVMQLIEKQPHLISQVVPQRKWEAAQMSENHTIDWTYSELRHTLHAYILSVRWSAKVFLLLDGLDELNGSDDAHEELISLLIDMAGFENVKICLSSRPQNIFRDAFREFPQLRLEDLTRGDISKYVEARLHGNIRFQHLLRYDRTNAKSLVSNIIYKAAGVFLWVRLVVQELLKGFRDGDDIRVLQKILEEIPADLNDYFKRLMDSISPRHRQEASALLQIALYEHEFDTVHPLRLIDLSFIDKGRPDFITGLYNFTDLDLTDREGLQFRLDSTFRRLNSRCMGLLECHYHPEWLQDSEDTGIGDGQSFEPSIYPQIFRRSDLLPAFDLSVSFIHRSCRDFLLTFEVQSLLHQYTQGPYDSRLFLLSSRLSQFVALETTKAGHLLALAIASNLLSTLSLPAYKCTPICAVVAATIQPILERLIHNYKEGQSSLFIVPSIVSWNNEQSTFLTLAIDFDLSYYVRTHLTSECIHEKRGRPILDYILRPRFASAAWVGIGSRSPNLEILEYVLSLGADPNEMYGFGTVWALFLCFLADFFAQHKGRSTYSEYSGALSMLVRAGADSILPRSWLSHETQYKSYQDEFETYMSPEELFSSRWTTVVPVLESSPDRGSESWYSVSDLLEHFRPYLGSAVDESKGLLESRDNVLT